MLHNFFHFFFGGGVNLFPFALKKSMSVPVIIRISFKFENIQMFYTKAPFACDNCDI